MTVGELLGRIGSRELTEWMAYYALEPFGAERGDLQAGIVAATVANVNRDKKKQREPFTPQDFMPDWEKSARKREGRSMEELLAKVQELNAAFGGRDER